jgi:dTDP-4-dehydrorhamnose reductase
VSGARILLLGSSGQVGHELSRELSTLGPVWTPGRPELDLADPDTLRAAVREHRPGLIVNAAAYTAVDRAEGDEARCRAINATAVGVLAEEARRAGIPLVHFSTDYVFDGTKDRPYVESDATAPLNVYGRTKLEGEQALLSSGAQAYVLRISWVYDLRHRNFLTTIRRLAAERDELTIVADQVGVPTWSGAVATAVGQLAALVRRDADRGRSLAGLYHLSGSGAVSWADFARAILEVFPVPGRERVVVTSIRSADYPTPAVRPRYSVLDHEALLAATGIVLPHWQDQLRLAVLQHCP